MTKPKSDGNGQPGGSKKLNAAKAELQRLTGEIKALSKAVRNVRETAQELLCQCVFFALGVGSGNLKPLAMLVNKCEGLDQAAMVRWCEAFAGVERFSDKETGAKGFKATAHFRDLVEAFKKDKIAFAKTLREKPSYWTYKAKNPFEGLDYLKLIAAAGNKVLKAAADKDKASKVKHAEYVSKVNAFVASLVKDESDDGDDGLDLEDMPTGTLEVASGEGTSATLN